jgi:aminoglycoside phosphotransferase family enzyme
MSITLPDALLDTAAYPDRPADVELRETRGSWVFLAGRRAYKVPKPCARSGRDACAAEVRRGRRFAPGIYAGMVALVPRGPGGVAVAQESDPRAVGYAVEMRRYDERWTLAARLAAGQVDERDAEAIGAALAGWHAAVPHATSGPGLAAAVRAALDALAACGAVELHRVASFRRFFDAALTRLEPELARHAHAGALVRGHGDLRADCVLLEPAVQAVGAIAGEPADVAYDLAGLVVDLIWRDERIARAVVRGYRAAGGSPGSDRLLTVQCTLRALERACAAPRHEAANLLALAERLAWRARLPSIVCVAACTSTFASALADASGRRVIGFERVRRTVVGGATSDVYAALGRRSADAARRDGGVIVDAPFRRVADVGAFTAAAGRGEAAWIAAGAPFTLPQRPLAQIDVSRPAGELLDALARELDDAALAVPVTRTFYGARRRTSPDVRVAGAT